MLSEKYFGKFFETFAFLYLLTDKLFKYLYFNLLTFKIHSIIFDSMIVVLNRVTTAILAPEIYASILKVSDLVFCPLMVCPKIIKVF